MNGCQKEPRQLPSVIGRHRCVKPWQRLPYTEVDPGQMREVFAMPASKLGVIRIGDTRLEDRSIATQVEV